MNRGGGRGRGQSSYQNQGNNMQNRGGGGRGRGSGGGRGNFNASRGSGESSGNFNNYPAHQNSQNQTRSGPEGSTFSGSGFGSIASIEMPESESHAVLCKQLMGSGTEGQNVELVSNFFKISSKAVLVYQYSVTIKQEQQQEQKPKNAENSGKPFVSKFSAFLKKVSPEIIDKFIKQNPAVFEGDDFGLITDGAQTIYSTAKLNLELLPEVSEIELNGRMNRFDICVSLVSTIDLGEVNRYYTAKKGNNPPNKAQETVSTKVLPVYEQLFRYLVEKRFTPHQRNYYDLHDRKQLRSDRSFDSVAGFSTSVRLTEIGLAVNLHHKCAVLLSANMKTVDQLVRSHLKDNNLADLQSWQIRKASKLLGGLRIKTTHIDKEYVIDGLSLKGAHEYTFSMDDGSTSTVQQYFRNRWQTGVGSFPLVRTMSSLQRGNFREKIHLPMEVCQLLPDQFLLEHRQPKDQKLQTELLGFATLKPPVYFTKVVKFMEEIKKIEPRLLRHFGVDVSDKPVKLQGRVLPLPRVLTSSNPNQRYNQNTFGFYKVGQVPKKWAVFCYDSTVTGDQMNIFLRAFKNDSASKGLNFPAPTVELRTMESLADIQELFGKIREKKAFEFVLLVIPCDHETLDTDDLYAVSKYCDMANDELTSQCVKGINVKFTPKGYFNNLFDKVNMKLGGINTIVDPGYLQNSVPQLKMNETMLVGVDVNHPGEGDRGGTRISVAAAVASTDPNASRYVCAMRIQVKERTETVTQMEAMMSSLLAQYRKHNAGRNPKNVIVFRDGVGDGHMREIVQVELSAVETALAKLINSPGQSRAQAIKLACIVVQKRHSVRFGLTVENTRGRKPTFNVSSGTVVDAYIVEPSIDGMLLNSHYSQLGTSKPSKYTVLRDDFKLTADQLERLCFFTCHACARSRSPMSIPTPIKYADLFAFRTKMVINASQLLSFNSGRIVDSQTQQQQQEEEVERISQRVQVSERSASKMFYV